MKTIRKVGLTCCSNGQPPETKKELDELAAVLRKGGIEPVFCSHIYCSETPFSGTRRERAEDLMDFYRDPSIDAIFDISGGNLANEILDLLDFDTIRNSGKQFWGYSDLTCVINTILTMTGSDSVLYQVRNLVGKESETQQRNFFDYLAGKNEELFHLPHAFLQGSHAEGELVGGNIRCLLKLAGTPYFPETEGKIVFLEALRGNVATMTAFLSQLRQLGVFDKAAGIMLGTFTQMESEKLRPTIEELVLDRVPANLPVLKTQLIGHAPNSKALHIGKFYSF